MTSHKIKVKRLKNTPYAIQQGDPIGKGSFATIRRAYNLENTGQQLAVKIISITDDQTAKTIKSELQMIKELPTHNNLVNCMKIQISSEKNLYIVMEYCNQGNLQKYIFDNKNDLPEQKIWFFVKQFCDGYKVMYERSIIHRDIKPENILIKNGNFKISDFGLARVIKDVEFNENLSSKGTPLYMAPEIHYQKEGSSKVDVFSLGVILYRLAFKGRFPFFESGRTYHSVGEYFKQLMIKKLTFPSKHNRSPELVKLIERMLTKNKDQRIGWKQIFEIERIKFALRNQRRKEIVPMEQFRKSVLVIANASITDVKVIENTECAQNNQKSNLKDDESYLIIEEAFNKKNKSSVQQKLYRNKLIYTLIDLVNRRIIKTLDSQDAVLHPYIIQQLHKIVNVGMQFCLTLISRLEDVSGDWNAMSNGEILNFEDIFQNDRDIIMEKLKGRDESLTLENYQVGLYEILLYNILTEFYEYPKQVQKSIRVIVGFLLEIYDMVIKFNEEDKLDEEDQTCLTSFQSEAIEKFQQFLYSLENIKPTLISSKLKKMGLLFV